MIYTEHGICQIVDITERTIDETTKKYYIIQPLENNQQLTISFPVDRANANMKKMLKKEEAEEILGLFQSDGAKWIEKPQLRVKKYTEVINSGDRVEIAKIARTLLAKKKLVEEEGRRFYENDRKLLERIETTLYKELALALETTDDEITEQIHNAI